MQVSYLSCLLRYETCRQDHAKKGRMSPIGAQTVASNMSSPFRKQKRAGYLWPSITRDTSLFQQVKGESGTHRNLSERIHGGLPATAPRPAG
jgi:hypothetical protein